MTLFQIATETKNQIFHSDSWDLIVDKELILELVLQAKKNENRKARLCLHNDAEEIMQVTYLAFVAPYEDKIHCHPHRAEVLIPIMGEAEARIFDDQGNIVKKQLMRGGSGESFSSSSGTWHSLKVNSSEFVMIEIGEGPFRSDSTVLFNKKGG